MDYDTLATRRRRALYRAMHRGTKEMDWFLGRYADATLSTMDETALDAFEQLLTLADPDLNNWILDPTLIEDLTFAPLVDQIRTFHGLTNAPPTESIRT